MLTLSTVSVVGTGALGILFGKQLSDGLGNDCVRFVADKNRLNRYLRDGIYCNGTRCDFQFVDKDAACSPADLVLFAVKGPDLDGAIAAAKNQVGARTLIISLMNGISSEGRIGAVYGSSRLLYCIAQGMDAVREGNRLTYSHMGILCFGEKDGKRSERVRAVSNLFDRARLPYETPSDMLRRYWGKFMLNVGINQAMAVFETDYGGMQRDGEPRRVMTEAMREVIPLAAKEGVTLTEADVTYWLSVVDTLDPIGKTSMRQDLEAGRSTEADLFAGTVLRLGEQYGIAVPVNAFLFRRIREMEASSISRKT